MDSQWSKLTRNWRNVHIIWYGPISQPRVLVLINQSINGRDIM